jgi:hypothetical protein
VILPAILIGGCGGAVGQHAASARTAQSASETVEHPDHNRPRSTPIGILQLSSPVGLQPIRSRFTCDGENVSPPLKWGKVPHHTVEEHVYIFGAEPVHGHFAFALALAGISPRVHSLSAGEIPKGAIVGRNSFGEERYSLCPPASAPAQYAVFVYTLPRKVHAHRGFDPEVLLEETDEELATTSGQMVLSYTRR